MRPRAGAGPADGAVRGLGTGDGGLGTGDWGLGTGIEVMVRDYRELEVWRLAMDLSEAVYRLTRKFPKTEEYRLTSQLLRAVVSIPANLAEGNARSTRKDYARFVSIARGSL